MLHLMAPKKMRFRVVWSVWTSSCRFTKIALALIAEGWTGKNLSDVRGGILQGINTKTGAEIHATGGFAQLSWTHRQDRTLQKCPTCRHRNG